MLFEAFSVFSARVCSSTFSVRTRVYNIHAYVNRMYTYLKSTCQTHLGTTLRLKIWISFLFTLFIKIIHLNSDNDDILLLINEFQFVRLGVVNKLQSLPFANALYRVLNSSSKFGLRAVKAFWYNRPTFFGSPKSRSKRIYRSQTSLLTFPKFNVSISRHFLSDFKSRFGW